MSIKITELKLEGVLLLESDLFPDDRGTFMEAYNRRDLIGTALEGIDFVQDNISCSHRGVFRGMHAQHPPYGQSKYVRAVSGRLLDIVLDIAPTSPTYGQAIGVELDASKGTALFIPAHYAHGFLALEEETRLYYKVDNFYTPGHEITYNYRHPNVFELITPHIHPEELILSDKDKAAPMLTTKK